MIYYALPTINYTRTWFRGEKGAPFFFFFANIVRESDMRRTPNLKKIETAFTSTVLRTLCESSKQTQIPSFQTPSICPPNVTAVPASYRHQSWAISPRNLYHDYRTARLPEPPCPRITSPRRCYQQPSFDAKGARRICSKTNKECWKALALTSIVRIPNGLTDHLP